jgi:hypothetical protein
MLEVVIHRVGGLENIKQPTAVAHKQNEEE